MKKTTYQCDLCYGEFIPGEILGFEFDGKDDLVIKMSMNVNRHWCKRCAKSVVDMMKSMGFEEFMRTD